VDIRADLYSLGCSFYYLLTGQPPFAGGSLLQKLLKHRETPAKPLAHMRPEAPRGLQPILDKMIAKKADDRYRSPASLAAALATLAKGTATAILKPDALKGLPPKSPPK
jgi:serine/threonine-protein kinase